LPPCIRSRSRWRGARSSSKSDQKRKKFTIQNIC
jgi:hypothetical protein